MDKARKRQNRVLRLLLHEIDRESADLAVLVRNQASGLSSLLNGVVERIKKG